MTGSFEGSDVISLRIRGGKLTGEDAHRIAAAVRSGGTVLYPTDTFYALGADPRSAEGVRRVFALKRRPASQPLLLLLDGEERVERYAASVSPAHRALMERFWPGPLTLLFPARGGLAEGVVSSGGEVALRVPGNTLSREVVAAAGGGLTGTSANLTGEPPRSVAALALASLGEDADLVVDAGTLPAAEVSTLLRLSGGRPTALREGALKLGEIEEFLAGGKGE
jgi:L-threonylcarbamoyladenylate synthase